MDTWVADKNLRRKLSAFYDIYISHERPFCFSLHEIKNKYIRIQLEEEKVEYIKGGVDFIRKSKNIRKSDQRRL